MAQKAPDGTPYAPRQQQSARKRPVVLSENVCENLSPVVFAYPRQPGTGINGVLRRKSPKIASVHQFGLSEETRKKDGKKIDYPARPLLGFTGEDVQMIEEIIQRTSTVSCAIPDTSSSHCRRYDPAASFPL